jgi:hypothetical protein
MPHPCDNGEVTKLHSNLDSAIFSSFQDAR